HQMSFRTKFKCFEVSSDDTGIWVSLQNVDGDSNENAFLAKRATGDITIHVKDPAQAELFKQGAQIYVDFSAAHGSGECFFSDPVDELDLRCESLLMEHFTKKHKTQDHLDRPGKFVSFQFSVPCGEAP